MPSPDADSRIPPHLRDHFEQLGLGEDDYARMEKRSRQREARVEAVVASHRSLFARVCGELGFEPGSFEWGFVHVFCPPRWATLADTDPSTTPVAEAFAAQAEVFDFRVLMESLRRAQESGDHIALRAAKHAALRHPFTWRVDRNARLFDYARQAGLDPLDNLIREWFRPRQLM